MAHIDEEFTRNVEIGAVRIYSQDGLEIVTTDGLREVRNMRTDEGPRTWEVSIPTCNIEDPSGRADYDSVRNLWINSERGLNSFNFHCFVDDVQAKVRFDSPLQITAPATHLRHIDTFTLKEVLGE